jgi:dolichol-phosphate mannosyltransferase
VAGYRDVLARGADVVVQIDADFSHPVRFLPALLEPLAAGRADLVLGSRYVKGGQIPRWNIFRRVISRGGSIFAGVVLLMPYRDLTGGFKAFSAPVLRAIDLDRLHAGGYAFQIETTFQARLAGASIVEVPITFEERRAGQSKMSMAIFTSRPSGWSWRYASRRSSCSRRSVCRRRFVHRRRFGQEAERASAGRPDRRRNAADRA